ncbi:hypothetical protein LPB138_10125 [Urechidicola croceus]|uniref:Nicotinic acid mononucleotide adenyltransferase n=2 Tax=Urechidicola croceus TaxID=1850246 RepID=A0A1D8PBW1_9FLAO|nr:hypothetical protein LPB138_10125 [Urechidicola croceus]
MFSGYGFAQVSVEPTYEKQGDIVSVTTYYEDGSVKEQGFYKDKKLHGEWSKFNRNGDKIILASYDNGRKVGTWMYVNNGVLTQVDYQENKIASVYEWNNKTRVAIN